MKVLKGVRLEEYTTFRMGGVCENLYFPESEEQLVCLINQLERYPYLLGGGSNLLVHDQKVFDHVVCMKGMQQVIQNMGAGRYKVSASVPLQKLITTIHEDGYGGIEYLFSVPGLVGGAIVMNAGRGKDYCKSICDYVESVTVLEQGERKDLSKEDCHFAYRSSVFKGSQMIILSAVFCFEKGEKADLDAACRQRLELVKKVQDTSAPNFGSVFCRCDLDIMKRLREDSADSTSLVRYSSKTVNWMLNKGGEFKTAMDCILKAEQMHQEEGKECEREVIVWE